MNLLAQTYFELARAKKEEAIPVIKAMLTQAIFTGEEIALSYWQTMLRLQGSAVAELLPDSLIPDRELWNAIFAQVDAELIQRIFSKHPDSLYLDQIEDNLLKPLIGKLQLSLTKGNFRQSYASLTEHKLTWMLQTQPSLAKELLESQGISDLSQHPELLPLVGVPWLIQRLQKDSARSSMNWQNLLTFILKEIPKPYHLNQFIQHLLLTGNQFPGSRGLFNEKEAIITFAKLEPEEYLKWVRLQHLGGQVNGDTLTNIPNAGFNTKVTVAPTKNPSLLAQHYEIIREQPNLLSKIDPSWELAIFKTTHCRHSFKDQYHWPAVHSTLKDPHQGPELAQFIVAECLSQPGFLFHNLYHETSPIPNNLPKTALELITDYTHKSTITHEAPVAFISALLTKLTKQASRDLLIKGILTSPHKFAILYLISAENLGGAISYLTSIRELDAYKIKVLPENVEPLLQSCIKAGLQDHTVSRFFQQVLAFHQAPNIELLKEAVMQDCSKFRTRHLKNWEVVALARMAKMAGKNGPLNKLAPIIARRRLDISQPLAAEVE